MYYIIVLEKFASWDDLENKSYKRKELSKRFFSKEAAVNYIILNLPLLKVFKDMKPDHIKIEYVEHVVMDEYNMQDLHNIQCKYWGLG